MSYCFGVEIEIIAEPHKVRHPLVRAFYYEKLAASLRKRGQRAVADTLLDRYRKRAEHYDKWWITKDGSLGAPGHPEIPLEAVSPILSTDDVWEEDIDTFWSAWSKVFHMPTQSRLCGSHIHVSASPSQQFNLEQLRRIAFGVILYEDNVLHLLPSFRRKSKWCKPNSTEIIYFEEFNYDISDTKDLEEVRNEIWDLFDRESTIGHVAPDFMQGQRRKVLWNFQNVRGSGSIEFRGGPRLRGPVHTKRWIAFVVAFIHMCVSKNFKNLRRRDLTPLDMEQFWSGIRKAADKCQVKNSLPRDWETMCGSSSSDIAESMGNLGLSDSDSDSDTSTVYSKNDSIYADSAYDSDDKNEMIQELGHNPATVHRSGGCVIL